MGYSPRMGWTAETAGRWAATVGIGAALWFSPIPQGLEPHAWHLLAVFVATIASFVLRPMTMGPMVLLAIVVLAATGTVDFKQLLSGFGDQTVWLVVAAFLIASTVERSGFGRRVALFLVQKLGSSTRGLGYSLCLSELVLAPVVPSNTARGGGILAPIMRSLALSLDSRPDPETRNRAGSYLALVGAHANLITASMFLTAMAANPLVARAARDVLDVDFGWGTWALGGLVPGLCGLALLPLWIGWLAPPEMQDTRAAQDQARRKYQEMGPWSREQILTGCVCVLMLLLWSTKPVHGMGTALVAWVGVLVFLLSGVDQWKEIVGNDSAWDCLLWLGGLLAMANALKSEGVVDWFARTMQTQVSGLTGIAVVLVLALIYFYSMYGFSMLTAHISALVGAFFVVALGAGAPPLLTVGVFAYFSSLCACVTNYSTGPVIIYFGLGFVETGKWFRVGFLVSLFHIAIWLGIGLPWWKFLGWW